jgi:predicted metalloprotease
MRFGDRRTSDNVEFRGEDDGGAGLRLGGGGGIGGGMAGMLLSFVFSRFGIGGVLVLLLVLFLFGGLGSLTGGGEQSYAPQQQQQQGAPAASAANCDTNQEAHFACQVLASTEDRWTELFQRMGQRYEVPKMVIYQRGTRSGCGAAQSAMGPFYCPADHRVYLDLEFFQELSQRFHAPGDFPEAYVIAHEVGHHVQTLLGTADRIRAAQQGASEAQGNALQVRMELQADCYAGVWAASERASLDQGDLNEGLTAAAAIGDDTLQRAAQGVVVPESFTHGTSAQRQQALTRGFQSGDPAACETYTQGI